LISVNTNFAGIWDSGLVRKVADGFVAVFLLANLVIRFSTMFHYPPYNGYIAVFLGCVVLACGFVVVYQRYLKAFLFIFGFSFFLFGFPSMDMQSRIFELIVTCVATALFLINCGNLSCTPHPASRLNRPLLGLILCYVALSLFSLLLIPVWQIFRDFWFFGFPDFFFYVSIGQPYSIYYPIPAITRLILYIVLAVQLATLDSQTDAYKSLFLGLFSGGVFCAFIGLLDFYGVISLEWYRFGKTSTPGVLHSTFGNRGVFAEFVLTVVPFVLIGFMSKKRRIWIQVLLFGSLVVCEIALILAGARAGWVSYPLILLICWVFFYFSKEGRLESFHFKWKDLVKVAISVPITILISFLLIFQVFMPLSEYLKTRNNGKGVQVNATATTQYMKKQASRLINPGKKGRLYTWAEGYHVGKEAPVYGMGYESFCWHAHILADTSESGLSKFYQEKGKNIHLTPHSIFFQLFASGGFVGLGLWLIIVSYAIMLLLFDVFKRKRLLNIPVVISIISFHTYGVFQSMQSMSMIWSLIFISLGYAMTVDEKVMPEGVRRVMGVVGKVAVLLVLMGIFVYLSNFESKSLAKKYDKRIYAMDQDRDRFGGFFEHWKWSYGDYRWFAKRGGVRTTDDRRQKTEDGRQMTDDGKNRRIELEFYCRTPGLEEEPVVLTVSYDGRVLDEVVFSEDGGRRAEDGRQTTDDGGRRTEDGKQTTEYTLVRKYELPVVPGEELELLLEVSRTWIPHEVLGNFDRRSLGVGVKLIDDR
jgi:O-antigen ligase